MRFLAGVMAALVIAGCGGGSAAKSKAVIKVTSPVFAPGGPIPLEFTCDGQDVSPPVRWSHLPRRTERLSLVMRDPDAPGGNFIHWQLSGISAATSGIPEGGTPTGASVGRNSFGSVGYRGPCPPVGSTHHYVITITATSGGVAVGSGMLVGTYTRR